MSVPIKENFDLNIVLIKDNETGQYCAFFAEIPEAISQGKDEKDAIEKLIPAAKWALEERKQESMKEYLDNFDYTIKPYKLVHA